MHNQSAGLGLQADSDAAGRQGEAGVQAGAPGSAPGGVLFVCHHGAAKSVLAMAYFEQLAGQHGLPHRALACGLEPDAAVSPGVVEQLKQDGLDVSSYQPRHIDEADLAAVQRLITLGCELPAGLVLPADLAHEDWSDIPPPSVDLPAAQAAIRRRVAALVAALAPELGVRHG